MTVSRPPAGRRRCGAGGGHGGEIPGKWPAEGWGEEGTPYGEGLNPRPQNTLCLQNRWGN